MSERRRAAEALVQLRRQPVVGRRSFLRGTGLAGLAVGSPALLAACGTDAAVQTTESCVSEDKSATEKVVNWSNWPEYIDVAGGGKRMPTLEDFEQASGIDVAYTADVNDNVEFFAKVQNQLADCQPTGRDIFVLTDWMAARMINLGWIQELDRERMPNFTGNLQPSLASPSWDPERKYSAPWQSGLTGIAYNAKFTGEVGSFEELLTRADLKGKISLLTEMNDTMAFMLKVTGADPTDFSDDEWGVAIERLEEVVAAGQVRRFTGNDYVDDLNAGNVVACEAWSGDVIAMQYDNPDIKFVLPEEGLALWSDNMLVPNKADHKANAEDLIDHYYDPMVAARLAAWVNYICPVAGAQEAMEQVDASLVDNPLIFPTEDFLANTFAFMALEEEKRTQYEQDFSRAIGA